MAQENRKTRFPGIADAVCRSRFSPYLFSFLLAFCGLIAVFLLARDAGAYLSETQAAEWYGLLRSLGRGDALAALSESKDLALLSFAYDPINRILSLFSFSSLIWGVCLMNAIRCGLAAAAFAYFLKLRNSEDLPAVLFSVLYALSSYALVSQLNGIAVDGVIVLPLLLAGIERIVSRRGFTLCAVSLALCAVLSFATLFGFFFFSLLWLVVVRLSRPGTRGKDIAFDLLLILLSCAVAIPLSAPVLFPAFDRLKITFIGLSFTQNYNLVEFFGKMLPATYDGLSGNRFPYLFIGMIPLLLLPVFFLCKKISVREKIVFGSLLFFLYFTFSINVLSAFWDLFAVPTGYHFTLALLFPALFLAMSARAFAEMNRASERTLTVTALLLAVLISLLQRMDLSYETAEGNTVAWFSEINSVWVPLPFLAVGCAGLLAVIRARESSPDRPRRLLSLLSILLMLATVLDVSVSGAALAGVIAKKEGEDVSATEGNHAYTSAYYAAYSAGFSSVGIEGSLYRAEKFDAKTNFDASYLGYATAADLPADVLSLFGIEFDEDGTLKTVSSPLSLSLFGVRYVMTHEPIETKVKEKLRLKQTTTETAPTYDDPAVFPASLAAFYEPICQDDAGTVYETPYALPVLFRAAAIPDASVLNAVNATPYSRINEVFRILTGDETLSLYVPATIKSFYDPYCDEVDVPYEGYVGYRRNSLTGTATLQYTVKVERDGPLFCSFPTEYPLDFAYVERNGTVLGTAYSAPEPDPDDPTAEDDGTLLLNSWFLGDFSEGETVRVSLTFGSGDDDTVCILPSDVPFIYEVDFDAVERAVTLLNDKTGATRARGETITVASSDDPAFPAVITTLSASSAKVNAKDDGSFLGVFAAGNTDGKRATLSPALSDLPVYSASLIGCLVLALLLFLETLSAGGARIPFFSREAGGTEDEKR